MTRLPGWVHSAVVALVLLLAPGLSCAQPVQEHLMKAAFVYNFVLFTDWPAETVEKSDTVNICVDAGEDMRDALQALNGKQAKGQRLKVIVKGPQDKGVGQCHVLYVEAQNRGRWPGMRKAAAEGHILTVSDEAETGAMVTLALADSKIVFDIDQSLARQARLTFSSKLLRLARSVK